MKRMVIITALVLTAAVQAQGVQASHRAKHADAGYSVYPRFEGYKDSNGMRVCHQGCDNREIPGSGARYHDVTEVGMAMRECVTGSSIF
jgi:hypothetical protein